MQCPDCGYMMTALDKTCPRCAVLSAMPAFPKPELRATPPLPTLHAEAPPPPPANSEEGYAEPVLNFAPIKPSWGFLKTLSVVLASLLLYHFLVIGPMQSNIRHLRDENTAQQKQLDDQQGQIDRLRQVVNLNAEIENSR